MDLRDLTGFTVVFLALVHSQGYLLPGTSMATREVTAMARHAASRDARLRRLGIEFAAMHGGQSAEPIQVAATTGPGLLDRVAR